MSGVDLPTLQELMGHKDIKTTLRYTHLSSDHKHRAVAAPVEFGEKSPIHIHNRTAGTEHGKPASY
jgi:hypothetical protein